MPQRKSKGPVTRRRAISRETLRAVETAVVDLARGHDSGYSQAVADFFTFLSQRRSDCPGDSAGESVTLAIDRVLADWDAAGLDPAHALGSVYQHLLTLTPSCEGDMARTAAKGSARKRSGSYYTPSPLIDRLLDDTLEPLLINAVCATDPIASLLELKICDPACGSGLFLAAAARRIAASLKTAGYSGNAFAAGVGCVWGVDIDPMAVTLCRMALSMGAGEPLALVDRIVCADSLLADDAKRGEFDLVIGNPPWLSLSGRQRVTLTPELLTVLDLRYPEMSNWPALHSAFVLMALPLVREGGRVGFVLPLPMAYLDGYAAVRAAVDRCTDRVIVRDAGEGAFDEVTQAAGLFSFTRTPAVDTVGASAWPIVSDGVIVREVAPDVVRLLSMPPVPAGVFRDPGVHTGNMSEVLIQAGLDPDGDRYFAIREGRDVTPYRCNDARLVLDIRPPYEGHHYCRWGLLPRYEAVPILVRQTGDRPIAARHVDPTYFRNSVLACAGLPDVPIEVTLAVLNSDLIASWYRANFCDSTQRAFPQIKVRNLQRLPMFDPARLGDIADELVDRVRQREDMPSGAMPAALSGHAAIELLVRRLYEV